MRKHDRRRHHHQHHRRDGPWRKPKTCSGLQPDVGKRHLAALIRGLRPVRKMVITYQTYVVRMAKHTILVDTCR